MPYIPSPMENFNKNNPFIILAKKEYDQIMDSIQRFSKDCIFCTMITCGVEVVMIIIGLVLFIGFKEYLRAGIVGGAVMLILLCLLIAVFSLRRKVAWYIGKHPAMIEFDRLANLEVNAILVLNNEDILKSLHSLYTLRGELNMDIKYFIQRMRYLICVAGGFFFASAISLISVIMN